MTELLSEADKREIGRRLRQNYVFLPVFHIRGKRYRIRCRNTGHWNLFWKRQEYDEGAVVTLRIGPFVIVAMIDET